MAVRARVLEPAAVDETAVWNRGRRQYDGPNLVVELNRLYPPGSRPHRFIVAFTGRGVFAAETDIIYSWQSQRLGVGVVSSYSLVRWSDGVWGPEVIATRRLGVQFLSTTSAILAFTRATRPDCPTAYTDNLADFLQKRSKLCDSEIEQRDHLLRRIGGSPAPMGADRSGRIRRVYRDCLFDD